MSALPPVIEIGAIIADRYRIERVLDSGGNGVVVLATQLLTQRPVVMKLMSNGVGSFDPESAATKRFLREARAAAKLRGPHVVRVLDVASLPSGEPYIVLEHLEGADLERATENAPPLKVADAVDYVMQALEALAEAHAAGIIHRDVKPRNLFLTHAPDGTPLVKVLDFGLSKIEAPTEVPLTSTSAVLGSPGYMSPEQISRPKEVDARTDIWAIGVTLYRLLELRLPFESDELPALLRSILQEEPRPFARDDVPPELREIVLQCLEKDRQDRPADIHELASALAPFGTAESGARVERIARMLAVPPPPPGEDTTVPAPFGSPKRDGDTFPETPRVGEVIADKYEIERVLGKGGMGIVLAARHLQLGDRVAIKMLRGRGEKGIGSVERFVREARTAARVKNEHVARVIDVATLPNGAPYIVMEYLEGVDLARLLAEQGPLPVADAVDLVLQACVGIGEAHALGVVHRDLKPSNLFRVSRADGSTVVKVLDFGISKDPIESSANTNLTETGALFGSPGYMSPEQIRSAKRVDTRTDVWALGVILYELLLGFSPFTAESAAGLFAAITADPPRPMLAARPDLPLELERVVFRCLEKDRELRFASVAELAVALAPFAPPRSQGSLDRLSRAALPSAPPPRLSFAPAAFGTTERAWTGRPWPLAKRGGRVAMLAALVVGAATITGTLVMRTRAAGVPSAPSAATAALSTTAPSAAAALTADSPSPAPVAAAASPASLTSPSPSANGAASVAGGNSASAKPRVRAPARRPPPPPAAEAPAAVVPRAAPVDPTSGRGD